MTSRTTLRSSDVPLRIELVLPYLVRGGMETMVARLARALAARGHAVGVTCTEFGGPLADELKAEGHRVEIVPTLGLVSNARAPRLEAWLRHVKPDVVHVHSGTWLKTARAARRAGVPRVIHTVHGLLDTERWRDALLKRLAARYTDRIVTVSVPLQHFIASQLSCSAEHISVVLNGIDTKRFRPGPRAPALREGAGVPADALVIGNVARLQHVKNHELLIDAFARIASRVPAAHLVIVGRGPLAPTLLEQAQRLGVNDRVHMVGESQDTSPWYREFDLFVLSSRAEGTSMSILEAVASGVNVVATAVGGTPDLLAHGARGRLVPPEDPAALAEAMVAALTDPSRSIAADAARGDIVAMYSESAMVSAYERLYATPDNAAVSAPLAREAVLCAE